MFARESCHSGTHREVQGRTPMMNEHGKSDRPVVPGKSPNNARQAAAEGMEGRGLAKGNSPQQNASRTPSRNDAPSALERIRQAAKKDRKLRFTALLHHIYNLETLRWAYFSVKREAAAGVDGETWRHYGEDLEAKLRDLSERLKRGAYRAKPVRRVYIPKADGRQRPLGVTALEDKIVQRATVEVLNGIYEKDFLGFSYGFRPGRSPHHALDALYTALLTRQVNWVLDVDIRSFFDTISHEWLVKFLEHRIADRRVVRLIQKWLNAGVLEDGKRTRMEEGTPQGGSLTPRTQKITSSLSGGWSFCGNGCALTCVVYGCIFMTDGTRQRDPKDRAPQSRARVVAARRSTLRGGRTAGLGLRHFVTSSLSLPRASLAAETAGLAERSQTGIHRQTFAQPGPARPRVCCGQRIVHQRTTAASVRMDIDG